MHARTHARTHIHARTHTLKQEKVPNDWKRAELITIYKSGNKEEPLNYRPVSLTSIICKVCEKTIKLYGPADFFFLPKLIGDHLGRQKIHKRSDFFLDIYREAIEKSIPNSQFKRNGGKTGLTKDVSMKNKRQCMEEVWKENG